MNALRYLLAATIIAFAPAAALALTMGFNADLHNGTGQDAYDFHIEGLLKSASPPVQLADYVFPQTPIPNFDWTYDGGTITPLGNNMYRYKGGWSGNTPVPPSSVVHFGKYFDEECHNIFVELRGWWTDRQGNRIVPSPGTNFDNNPPLVGFDVQDQILDPGIEPQTVLLDNATPNPIELRNLEFAVTEQDVPLEELVADSPVLAQLNWVPGATGQLVIDNMGGLLVDLNQVGVFVPPNRTLITRFEVLDPTDGEYRFSAHRHTSHVPEPVSTLLIGLLAIGLVSTRRR